MLRIITTRKGAPNIARIFVTPDMSAEDRGRLASLANVMSGIRVPEVDCYDFTQVRGEKAWLLYQHGFRGVTTIRRKYTNERSITHPKYGKCFHLSNAVVIARLMQGEADPVVEAVGTTEDDTF